MRDWSEVGFFFWRRAPVRSNMVATPQLIFSAGHHWKRSSSGIVNIQIRNKEREWGLHLPADDGCSYIHPMAGSHAAYHAHCFMGRQLKLENHFSALIYILVMGTSQGCTSFLYIELYTLSSPKWAAVVAVAIQSGITSREEKREEVGNSSSWGVGRGENSWRVSLEEGHLGGCPDWVSDMA